MTGVHLEQIGCAHWRLSGGSHTVDLLRRETETHSHYWMVSVVNERDFGPEGRYGRVDLALAHAYALATRDELELSRVETLEIS